MTAITRQRRLYAALSCGSALLAACGGGGTGPDDNSACRGLPVTHDSRNWSVSDLGRPAPIISSLAYGVAGSFIAGEAQLDASTYVGFRWTPDQAPVMLDPVPGDVQSFGHWVNRQGLVVGTSFGPGGTPRHGVAWRGSITPDTAPVPGFTPGGVNDAGIIVGSALFPGAADLHAALWTPDGTVRDIGALAAPANRTLGTAINDAGMVTGRIRILTTPTSEEAFVWSEHGGMVRLGLTGGAASTVAGAINQCGFVAGDAIFPGGAVNAKPWRWTPETGMVILPLPADARISFVVGIDSLGVVFGNVGIPTATGDLRYHPYEWPGEGFVALPERPDPTLVRGIDRCGVLIGSALSGDVVTHSYSIVEWRAPC